MKGSIRARISAIVKGFGFKFKASTKAKDYGLVRSSESKHKFSPKKVFTWTETFNNNTDIHMAYITKTSHPELYVTPTTFIVKPHTTRVVTIHRMVQDEVLTPLSDGMIAEEKIFLDYICVPEDTSVKDIRSIFRFKGKDYIVEKPKICASIDQEKQPAEVEERGSRTVTIVTSVYDYN